MSLSAQSIRTLCRFHGLIFPFYERTVFMGKTFGLGPSGYDVRLAERLTLRRGAGIHLGSTIERFHMPHTLMAEVKDKSTWVRQGLTVQNTVIEPGWRGHLTLELLFDGLADDPADVCEIAAGSPIAQIVFHPLDEATQLPYRGKYQDQPAGPQPAKHERDDNAQ